MTLGDLAIGQQAAKVLRHPLLSRMWPRDVETRIDEQSLEFHKTVRDAYRHLADDEPKRVKLIDGNRPEAAVAADVWATVEPLLAK